MMFNLLKKEIVLFGLVGVLNTGINFAVYTLLVLVGVPYLLANVVGYGVGMINSYFLNKHFVFKQKEQNPTHLAKFIIVNLMTVVVHSILLYVAVTTFGFHKILSQVFVTGITFVMNFVGNKLWTFK
ncbi:GtrA family protein [Sutcliffiella sp. NPDC057660]|uniref:GtrA family protein n=1 Tax=Sutcliffiella sp. NPDC057660 TaxID=3346199 RepID=UPI0036754A50